HPGAGRCVDHRARARRPRLGRVAPDRRGAAERGRRRSPHRPRPVGHPRDRRPARHPHDGVPAGALSARSLQDCRSLWRRGAGPVEHRSRPSVVAPPVRTCPSGGAHQHSTTLTARPPIAVSLYLSLMSAPVAFIVAMTSSRLTKCSPSPHSAILAALIDLPAPIALRSMHGTWTRPAIGSQVSPRLCSIAISAAFSTCSVVPPSTWARPPAAIDEADPTSPWQPTSAPEIDAPSL